MKAPETTYVTQFSFYGCLENHVHMVEEGPLMILMVLI